MSLTLITSLFKVKVWDEAKYACDKAIELRPNSVKVLINCIPNPNQSHNVTHDSNRNCNRNTVTVTATRLEGYVQEVRGPCRTGHLH